MSVRICKTCGKRFDAPLEPRLYGNNLCEGCFAKAEPPEEAMTIGDHEYVTVGSKFKTPEFRVRGTDQIVIRLTTQEHRELMYVLGYACAKAGRQSDGQDLVERIRKLTGKVREAVRK
jgi:hypothetical protein